MKETVGGVPISGMGGHARWWDASHMLHAAQLIDVAACMGLRAWPQVWMASAPLVQSVMYIIVSRVPPEKMVIYSVCAVGGGDAFHAAFVSALGEQVRPERSLIYHRFTSIITCLCDPTWRARTEEMPFISRWTVCQKQACCVQHNSQSQSHPFISNKLCAV